MQALGVQLLRLLDGHQHYMVPLFQRPYTWQKPQWETLWNDLMETLEAGGSARHFLGSVVTKSLSSTPEGVNPFLLIDGQQRLTTLTILLSALRNAVRPTMPQLANKIHEHYLTNEYAPGLMQYKVLPTQLDRPSYFAVIDLANGSSTAGPLGGKIGAAYSYFSTRLSGLDPNGEPLDLNLISQAIMNSIEIVSIVLDEKDNEYSIFESLNAKGTPLSQGDLLRNYFFMRIPNSDHTRLYPEHWVPMQNRVGESLPDFFRYEYMSDGDFVRKWDVYQDWKERLDPLPDSSVGDTLVLLSHRSHFYQHIISPDTEPYPALAERFRRLNTWGAQSTYPFLMYLYRHFDSGNLDAAGFVDILRMIESFLVRRALTRVSSNTLNRLFIRLSVQLPQGYNLVEGTRLALSEPSRRWPRDNEFVANAITYPLYVDSRRPQSFLILESLERSYKHKEHVDFSNLSIEHIMPQSLTPEWRTELGERADRIHSRFLHTLGNLTLTAYNSELSNDPFSAKKLRLQNSNLEMNKEVAAELHWTEEQILARATRLAERALDIWPGPLNQDISVVPIEPIQPSNPTEPPPQIVGQGPFMLGDTSWTPALAAEFWSYLTDKCKRILTEVATQPAGIGIEDVRIRLGLGSNALGGILSSVGFAMNRLKKRYHQTPKDYPYHTDYSAWTFSMPPDLAQMILQMSENYKSK